MKHNENKYRKPGDLIPEEFSDTNRLSMSGSTIFWELLIHVNSKSFKYENYNNQ